jgi:hypothetical protein
MKNEPVAWLVDNQAYTSKEVAESLSKILETPVIPLYTHPVKELTDEEIWELWELMNRSEDAWVPEEQVQGFARAILRKASEK